MTKKSEFEKSVGKSVLKDVKESIKKDIMGDDATLVGAAKKVSDILDQAIESQQQVTMQLYRKNNLNQSEEFLSNISNLNPQTLKEQGIESIIKEWSGGGEYRGVIKCAGIPDKRFNAVISGDPLAPKPERTNQQSHNMSLNSLPQMGAPVAGGNGNYYAGPGFGSYLGLGAGGYNPAQNQMLEIAQMFAHQNQNLVNQLTTNRRDNTESEAVKKLELQLMEEKRRSEQREAEARHREEMTELRKVIEENKKPAENPTIEMLKAVAPVIAPLFFAERGKSSEAQSKLFETIMLSQKESANQTLEVMKQSFNRPTIEDRMSKQAETMGNFMGNVMGLMSSAINQMAALQGGSNPWWQDTLTQIVDGAIQIGSSITGKAVEEEPNEMQQYSEAPPAMVMNNEHKQLDPAQEAQAARKRMEEDANFNGMEAQQIKPENFSKPMQELFERINGDTNPHEIAFALWSLATVGDPAAQQWLSHVEEVTKELLGTFVEQGYMDITDDRAIEIWEALEDLNTHFAEGGNADDYVKRYELTIGKAEDKPSIPPAKVIETPSVPHTADLKKEDDSIKPTPTIDQENDQKVEKSA